MPGGKTLFDKVWDSHLISLKDHPLAKKFGIDDVNKALLYVDLHLIHEVTSPQAFSSLRLKNRRVRRGDLTFATVDHNVPTTDRSIIRDPISRKQVETLRKNAKEFGITFFDMGSGKQGIVHVIGPELGLTLPGKVIVCGDSHTSTHGAFGALAFGIGTSQVEHVLSTQTIFVKKPKKMRVLFRGKLPPGVYSKDMILALIRKIGTKGATGHVIEYAGEVISSLSMEKRLTICNMSIEAGARAGMIAPDDTTFSYLYGREYAPKGELWEEAVKYWRTLPTDEDAVFDKEVELDCSSLAPQVSWGTSPEMVVDVTERVPDPKKISDPIKRKTYERALEYMGLTPGTPIQEIPIDKVFIGSCTNARIEDLREAASVIRGRKKADSVKQVLVVPGSEQVKKQAEEEGLDKIFKAAGFEWREPGCSMCLAMNEDRLLPGERCASTSNRNFEGRQGKGGRTFLVSPAMAALAGIYGHFVDVRKELAEF